MTKLSQQDISEANLPDWRHAEGELHARYQTGDFANGLAFVNAVGEVAEEANHHPDVLLSYDHVELHLMSHDVGALTERDVQLARRISGIAQTRGIAAEPEAEQGQ